MPYIGRQLTQGNFIKLDDLQSQFNGTKTTFSLTAGIVTNTPVGINTSTVDDKDLTGIGNSFKGLYIGNGMVIHDSELTGTHYIGTSFRGMMAGPVTIGGTLTVDGNYVVV